tara:strand:+ start:461 stop:670 length:210 start_codon:yes stop_codon:yes gene_type:complete
MFEPGDLVQINLDCTIKYYWGMTAIVLQNMGHDATDHANGFYYKLQLPNGTQQIFAHKELNLVSKAERK